MSKILIIDDDEKMTSTLAAILKREGHETGFAHNLKKGLKEAISRPFDVIFLDVMMPDGNGLDLLPELRETPSRPEVIIITAAGSPDGAEIAVKNGAWDYLQKPFSIEEIKLQLLRALQYRKEKTARKLPVALKQEGIIGSSLKMKACLDLLAQAANSMANVMITGETGTGKELFARAIHENSPRSNKNIVVVDCTSLPDTLVESVLFGHEKGSFTGADNAMDGLIKQADGGTLFLDEVGELPLSIQKSFLRVLQEHRFRPVGGKREVQSDFRLVSATNRNLDEMVRRGQFRKDLLFRLQSFGIELPPLREHTEDINELTMYYMTKICNRYEMEAKGFSPEFFQTLAGYDWPGNVRELVNTLEKAIVSARHEPILFPIHLPDKIRIRIARDSVTVNNQVNESSKRAQALNRTLPTLKEFRSAANAQAEKQYLQELSSLAGNDIQEACRISGIGRSRLYGLLRKHKISLFD